jgi:hypothetical protein
MPVPDNLKELTRRQWRDLGFYYAHDAAPRPAWRIVGPLAGLAAFHAALLAYVAGPSHAAIGEHDHFGPYWYLKVMTSRAPGIDAHSIQGTLDDLRRLTGLVANAVEGAKPGDEIAIGHEYVEKRIYELVLDVREDGFDPASADPELGQSVSRDD